MLIDLNEIFDPDLGGTLATLIVDSAAEVIEEREINIAFRRDQQDTVFGDDSAYNANPLAWMKTEDAEGISSTSKLIVHYGYLMDEAGEEKILDESGEPIIVENKYTYNIKSHHDDAFGVTDLQLTLDSTK